MGKSGAIVIEVAIQHKALTFGDSYHQQPLAGIGRVKQWQILKVVSTVGGHS